LLRSAQSSRFKTQSTELQSPRVVSGFLLAKKSPASAVICRCDSASGGVRTRAARRGRSKPQFTSWHLPRNSRTLYIGDFRDLCTNLAERGGFGPPIWDGCLSGYGGAEIPIKSLSVQHRLRRSGGSGDRTWSQAVFSPKREYSRTWPETFANSGLQICKARVQRPNRICEKAELPAHSGVSREACPKAELAGWGGRDQTTEW
jgi:hypothetical protein